MKSIRYIAVALFIFFSLVSPSNGCGPFLPEAVFVQHMRPDGSYADFAQGRIGVPQAAYRVRHLVIAYDWLNGHGLTDSEQRQAIALDAELSGPARGSDVAPGLTAWIAARKASGVPGGPQDSATQARQQGTAQLAAQTIVTDRADPGADYQTFPNCLDDAFATAARTLEARKAAHADDPSSVADWIHGQDAVFANCGGTTNTQPVAVAPSAPAWLRQDRAYQLAAAMFYQTDYDGAIRELRTISADTASPWHPLAKLITARCMIRKATVGQITEAPASAPAENNAPYDQKRADALQAYGRLVEQKRPARLAEARDSLQAILADPSLNSLHPQAAALLDFVMLRLDPTKQSGTLAARVTGANRSQMPGVFRQSLIDLTYLTKSDGTATRSKAELSETLLAWLQAMAEATERNPLFESRLATQNNERDQKALNAQAAKDAIAGWRSHHAIAWLIAALTAIQPDDPAAPELLRAASAVQPNSPAWVATTYHRLRLTLGSAATRSEIDKLLPTFSREQSRSTINLFIMLRQRTSPTLATFLQDAGTAPAGITTFYGDDADPPDTKPNPDGLCGLHSSEGETRLFNHVSATILNTRLPLRLLAEAAANPILPANLRFQIAQATWTRSVLLQQPEIAKRMSPILIGCYPAWKTSLEKYDSATSIEEHQVTGLLALMRFASTEPIVRDGEQRPGGFATYSEFRDNWWEASNAAGPPTNPDGTPNNTIVLPTFFGTSPATPSELPDPPFIGQADKIEAEHEVSKLRTIPCASDFFARSALAWQKQHPTDPRAPDVLGFAERVVRNSCRTEATTDLNHQLFIVVQGTYSKSEWANKYSTWE